MRKLLFISLLICSTAGVCAQTIKVGGIRINAPVTPPAGPTTEWRIDFANEYGCSGVPGYFRVCGTNANISTAGNISFPAIAPTTGSGGNITFVNGSGFVGYYDVFTPPEVGQPSGSGIFPDIVVGFGWKFNNGATFTIGGLTVGQLYTMYFLSNQPNYEPATVSFSVQGITSSQINNSNNFGSSATSPWYSDASLVSVTFTATATSATVICNLISGPWGSINEVTLTK